VKIHAFPLSLALPVLAALVAGCSEPTASEPTASEPTASEPTASEPTAPEPAVDEPAADEPAAADRAPAEDPPAQASSGSGGATTPADGLQGAVVETMDAGGYTYALLDTGSEKVWVAGPPAQLVVGEQVQALGAMPMRDFRSPSLDRTFDVLYFAQQIARAGQAPAAGLPAGHGTSQEVGSEASTDVTGIDRAEGGRTVEEVFLMKAELVGAPITIRGKVVKYNAGILGKNWLHIQDGTGSAGTNDLTITTQATCAVGDTVLVHGKLVADRDFGAGYVYDLIVEDAQVTVE
jgi:hypothetical protein